MSDRQIITPHCFPKDWTPPPGSPGWATPLHEECTIPPTIREAGIDRVLNRKVTWASCHLGTYGMGGAGLVGVGLEGHAAGDEIEEVPEEFLVLCIWGADNWLHWNDQVIDNNFDDNFTPLGYKEWEKQIIGKTLLSFDLQDTTCKLQFDDNVLEFKDDPSTRSVYSGNKKQRIWDAKDSLKDAWFLAPDWRILV